MKTVSHREHSISKEAGKEGKTNIEQNEKEVEKTSGDRKEHESPIPDADQHRSKEHTSKPQIDERDTM